MRIKASGESFDGIDLLEFDSIIESIFQEEVEQEIVVNLPEEFISSTNKITPCSKGS